VRDDTCALRSRQFVVGERRQDAWRLRALREGRQGGAAYFAVFSAEARPRPKQQRLDRAACQAQSRGDLGVAQSADFAQREGGAM